GALDYLSDNTAVLWQVPIAAALLALFYAMLGVAVASLSGRRMLAGATMLGITLVSSAVSGILIEADAGPDPGPAPAPGAGPQITTGHPAGLLNILATPLRLRDLVFLGRIAEDSPLSGVTGGGAMSVAVYVAVVALCAGVILARYRTAE
ncbi:MAG: hypothetical protein Q8K72_15900, partial [Acidimicrobiales bacterium]|nr:hypothetical protein [Acidimicrobiales bacterium]